MSVLQRTRTVFNIQVLNNLIGSSKLDYNSFNEFRRKVCNSSPRNKNFVGEDTHGDYTKGPKVIDVLKSIWNDPKILLKQCAVLKEDLILFRNELSDLFNVDTQEGLKGEIDMLFTFEEDKSIKKFRVITDKTTINGKSTASFVRTQYDSGLFSGYIDHTPPLDGTIQYSGFASIMTKRLVKSFGRTDTYNWDPYTHLVLKIRGDGRTYTLILGCPDYYDITWQDQYHYPLFTRGGPYWQIAKIPFSNFYFTSKGKIQDNQSLMDLRSCSRIGISLGGVEGPFKLEIDYIGLEHQPFHKSICPYESYYVRKM